jgi:Fe-S-cluster containining protein
MRNYFNRGMTTSHSPEQDFSFVVETPDGKSRQLTVRLPRRPVRLSELVPVMQVIADEIIALAVAKASERGERVSCRAGCGACCCQLIPLAAPEVSFIIERLLRMPVEERIPILQRFETIEKRMEECGLAGKVRTMDEPSVDNNAVARDYFHLKEPCPFLVSESCSMHEWRPVVCREFNATSPPGLCSDPFSNKLCTVPLFKRPSMVLALLASRMANIPAALVPMPLMFDWHESNRPLCERTWAARHLVETLLEITIESGGKRRGTARS